MDIKLEKIVAFVIVLYFCLTCFLFRIIISNFNKKIVQLPSRILYCAYTNLAYCPRAINSLLRKDFDEFKYETNSLIYVNSYLADYIIDSIEIANSKFNQ